MADVDADVRGDPGDAGREAAGHESVDGKHDGRCSPGTGHRASLTVGLGHYAGS
jgi:hypothetical protein